VIAALSLFIGIESSVVLRDVCLLSVEKAREVKIWGASAILSAALAEAEQATKTKPAKKSAERGPVKTPAVKTASSKSPR